MQSSFNLLHIKGSLCGPLSSHKSISLAPCNAIRSRFLTRSHQAKAPQGKGMILNKMELPGVKKIIAVASGKGGVGKSTTAGSIMNYSFKER